MCDEKLPSTFISSVAPFCKNLVTCFSLALCRRKGYHLCLYRVVHQPDVK